MSQGGGRGGGQKSVTYYLNGPLTHGRFLRLGRVEEASRFFEVSQCHNGEPSIF